MSQFPLLDPRMPPPDHACCPWCSPVSRQRCRSGSSRCSGWGSLELCAHAEQALRVAAGLAGLGVKRGDTVLIWLPNGRLGIVVMVRRQSPGRRFGRHQHRLSRQPARACRRRIRMRAVAICHEDLVDRLLEMAARAR